MPIILNGLGKRPALWLTFFAAPFYLFSSPYFSLSYFFSPDFSLSSFSLSNFPLAAFSGPFYIRTLILVFLVSLGLLLNYFFLAWGWKHARHRLSQEKLSPKKEILLCTALLLPLLGFLFWQESWTGFILCLLFFSWLLMQFFSSHIGSFYTAFIGLVLVFIISLSYFLIRFGEELLFYLIAAALAKG